MRILLLTIISLMCIHVKAQTIINYTTADGLLDNFVECIDICCGDAIWLGTSVGVQMTTQGATNWYSWDQANYPDIVSDNIKCVKATSSGEVWIGTDYGVNHCIDPFLSPGVPGGTWTAYTTSNGLVNNQVKSIDEDASGGIWIGTNQGVSHFDGASWVSYTSPDIHWSGVNGTAFDSNGDVWFASPLGGVTHFDGINFTVYDTSNGLLSQNVTDIVIDAQDNKWIGTGGGISILNASNTLFTHHTQMYILSPPDTLNPVVEIDEKDGFVWTAIYVGYLAQGGVAQYSSGSWYDYDVNDGLVGSNVRGISIDSDYFAWVATSEGVSVINSVFPSSVYDDRVTSVKIFPNPSNDFVYLANPQNIIKGFTIYNNLGSLIYESKDPGQQCSIDVYSFERGIYYINIQLSDSIISEKMIIN